MSEDFNNPREVKEVFKNLSPDFHSYLVSAQKLSKLKKHNYVGVEHFLAAFLSESKSVLRRILKNNKANWKKKVNDLLDKAYNPQKKTKLWEGYMVTPRIQRIWHEAVQSTQFKDSTEVKEAQFLLLMLEDEESFAFKWLQSEDYNVQRVIESVRDEASENGRGKIDRKSSEKEALEKDTEGKTSREKKESGISVDQLFKKTEDMPEVKLSPVSARESGFSDLAGGETIKIGKREVSLKLLRDKKLSEAIIDEIKGISKQYGSFPETLLIGQKEVPFDELIDMGLDEEAFIEVLEIAKEHFTESEDDAGTSFPATAPKTSIHEMPTIGFGPLPSIPDYARRYETQELDTKMVDRLKGFQTKLTQVEEDAGTFDISDGGYKTGEVPKELISKAKQEVETQFEFGYPVRSSPGARQPSSWQVSETKEPLSWKVQEPKESMSWKIDPFGIGQNEGNNDFPAYQGSTGQFLGEFRPEPPPEMAKPFPVTPDSFGIPQAGESTSLIVPLGETTDLPPIEFRSEQMPQRMPFDGFRPEPVPGVTRPQAGKVDLYGIGQVEESPTPIVPSGERAFSPPVTFRDEPNLEAQSRPTTEIRFESLSITTKPIHEGTDYSGLERESVPDIFRTRDENVRISHAESVPAQTELISREIKTPASERMKESFPEPIADMDDQYARVKEPVKDSFKTVPDLFEPPDDPQIPRATGTRFQQKPISPINADYLQEQIAAKDQVVVEEPVEITMVGLKKRISVEELFAMIHEWERIPSLFDDEFGDRLVAAGAQEVKSSHKVMLSPQSEYFAPEFSQAGKDGSLPKFPEPEETTSAQVQVHNIPGFPGEGDSDHLSVFPLEPIEAEKSSFLIPKVEYEYSGEEFLINASLSQDRYPWDLWDHSEAEEIAGLIASSSNHVALLIKSPLKARKILKYLREKIMSIHQQELYLIETERFQTLSIDEIAVKINRVKEQIAEKRGCFLAVFDIGLISRQSVVKASIEELLQSCYENEVRCVCSMTQKEFEEDWIHNEGAGKMLVPINVKDVSIKQTKMFLRASADVIEKEIKIKIDSELIEQAPDIAVKFLEEPVFPDAILAAFRKAADFKREEFQDMGLEEFECIDKKDFLYIVSDTSL